MKSVIKSVLSYFRSALEVGLKFILSIYHLLQLHCWLWGCCSFACTKFLLIKTHFLGGWSAQAELQPLAKAGQSLSDFSPSFSSKSCLDSPCPSCFLPEHSPGCVNASQSLSECTKSLFKAFNLQTAGGWGWGSPGIVHFNCSRSGGVEPEKSWDAPHFIGNKTSFCWCSLFRITWLNCAKRGLLIKSF